MALILASSQDLETRSKFGQLYCLTLGGRKPEQMLSPAAEEETT